MLDRMPLLVELMADARHRGGTAAAARHLDPLSQREGVIRELK